MFISKKQFGWLSTVAATILLIILTHYYISIFTPPGTSVEPVIIEFRPGESFYHVAVTLEEQGVIRSRSGFTFIAKMRDSTRRIMAGEYEFNRATTPLKVLEMLEKGMVIRHPVTIPEGYNIRDIAALLEIKGLSQREVFIAKTADKALLFSLSIDAPSVEGYLFPDTYFFPKGMPEDVMIKNMVSRFREVFTDEMQTQSATIGLTPHEVVILASVVEKETGAPEERPRIARVFLNRLRKGIPLQSDPTVIYGIKDFNGNLTRKDLRTKSPYNTYAMRGLPVGPIANPGVDSIRAVLDPEEGNYLYFVSRNNGTHYFSSTLSEHNWAVRQYQLGGRRNRK